MNKFGAAWIYLSGSIALIGALIHLAAMFGGISWYIFFNAPPKVVESVRAGTWLAPISTAIIVILMAICAAYAFSSVGLIRRLPLLRLILAGMTFVCLLRALILLPLLINHPGLRNTFEYVASIVWGIAGAGFMIGLRFSGPAKQSS